MILYIEKDILSDIQCRDLCLCSNGSENEYLLIESSKQCSCRKQQAILCKYDHDLCRSRCLLEQRLFIKQKHQSNNVSIDDSPTNVVLLNKHELEKNSEILYISHENNLPNLILKHLKSQLNYTNNSSVDQVDSSLHIKLFSINSKHRILDIDG